MVLAAIPSPSRGVVHLGPIPLRGYALMIILGILVAVMLSERRLRARGESPGLAADLATWAVPFGIIGARIYSVVTTPGPYFGSGGDPVQALEIWKGGLGIWGGVLGGALGAYICVRRRGTSLGLVADACAPGLVIAQGIGRWGNWFNQELYGRPTNLPWAVTIDPGKRIDPTVAHYQPTFLYESIWDIGIGLILLWIDRRHRLGRARLFTLYVAFYTLGRAWIEALRIDDAEHFFGVRLNDWVCLVVFVAAVIAFATNRRPVDPDVPPSAPDETASPGTQPTATSGTLTATATRAGSPDPSADPEPSATPADDQARADDQASADT
ncbi:MAG: prolipoprotein diacylglyceryl transferase [Frankia sp.]